MRRAALVWLALASGCTPDFGAPLSVVDGVRILAVRADPAEARPGESVQLTPLVAAPGGTVVDAALSYAPCLTPKPAAENAVVNPACLAAGGATSVASGPTATLTLPADGCRLFGPDLPPRTDDGGPLQSRLPDATGGYYQPVRIDGAGPVAVALPRLRCNLAAASPALAAAFAAQYPPNQNPQLMALAATVDGHPVALEALPAGAAVTLTLGWSAESAEAYPVLDVAAQQLVTVREALSVAWYAGAGVFADERTGRAAGDPATGSANVWHAPPAPATVPLWVVLHDDRGGVDVAAYVLTVR